MGQEVPAPRIKKGEQNMEERIAKLLSIKSIVTIVLLVAFVASIFMGVNNDPLNELVKLVIIFYFGTQAEKLQNTN
jgi:uncharacterized membrane protein